VAQKILYLLDFFAALNNGFDEMCVWSRKALPAMVLVSREKVDFQTLGSLHEL